MGLFSKRKSAPTHFYTPSEIIEIARKSSGNYATTLNTDTVEGQTKAYEQCSAVSSAINTICTYIKQFELWQVDNNGERVDGTKYISQIERPNPYQTLPDFIATIELAKLLYGQALIWRDPEFQYLYVLPNAKLKALTNRGKVSWTKPNGDVYGYNLSVYDGAEVRIELDDIHILQDVSIDLHKLVTGESRLRGKSDIINAYIAGYSAMAEITANRGPLGIVSMVAPESYNTFTAQEQKDDAERKLTSKYGLLKEQFRYIVTSLDSKFTPITANVSDLDLDASRKDCRNEIARAYNVPIVLLDSAGSTYANLATAERSLYQNVIFSDAKAIFNLLNDIMGFDAVRVMPYYDHLPCFQEQRKNEAAAFQSFGKTLIDLVNAGLITNDEARERLTRFEI